MSGKLLDKYTNKNTPDAQRTSDSELTELPCFGWLRGVRDRAVMLELRKKDGHILAIGYSWIERVEFQPEHGITLYVPGQKILIKGSGLNVEVRPSVRLFEGITRHRVPWINEADRSELLKGLSKNVFVELIDLDV